MYWKEKKIGLLINLYLFNKVLNLELSVQSDGSAIAIVQIRSQQEAQFAISQLHRQKLGPKRIIISYAQNNSPDPEQLRAMVIEILQVIFLLYYCEISSIIHKVYVRHWKYIKVNSI